MKAKFRIAKSELVFCIAVFCILLALQLELTTLPYQISQVNLFMKGLRYIAYVLILVKILMTRFTVKEFMLFAAVMCVLGIRVHYIGRNVFLLFLFIFGVKGLSFEKLAKRICVFFVCAVAIVILGGQFGLIENWGYNIESSRPRFALGYYYPSHATSSIFYTIVLLCYILREKLRLWHIVLLELFNYWQYTNTDSRTGSVLIGVVLIIFYLLKFFKKDFFKGLICKTLKWSFLFSAFVSLLGAYFFDRTSRVWLEINNFLSRRLELAHDAMETYGICFWGQSIKWIGYGGIGYQYAALPGDYNYVDCSYVKILLQEGLVFWILILIGYTLVCQYAASNKDIYLCFALAMIAVYSIMEPRLCELGFNPFMLTLVVLIDYRGKFIKQGQMLRCFST